MFVGKQDITSLVQLLKQRRVKIYHACQLTDFRTYLQIGGVPSRALMQSRGLPFTSFTSDDDDQSNGVWDCSFFNLSDSGHWFHRTSVAQIPNAFGPILLVFNPEVLLDFDNAAICLRSACGQGFQRHVESLISTDEADQLFKNPENHQYSYDLKWIDDLASLPFVKARRLTAGGVPEISCALSGKPCFGSFKSLSKIEVDPVSHDGS